MADPRSPFGVRSIMMSSMRARLVFYSDVVGLGVCGGFVGYFAAKDEWFAVVLFASTLVGGLVRVSGRYAPGMTNRRRAAERRRQAEREYECQEPDLSGPR